MDEGKRKFIQFLAENGLGIFSRSDEDRTLKSGRISPWFLNVGDFNNGTKLLTLSEAYADTIVASGIKVDSVYGIPEKGVGLVGPVSTALARRGIETGWFFDRKTEKTHGEGSGKSDLAKIIVGRIPQAGEIIAQLDDVFTDGQAKYDARKRLDSFGEFQLPLLAIALNRQEVNVQGIDAIAEYERKTGTKVVSTVKATEVIDYLKDMAAKSSSSILDRRIERLSNYLRVYGTEEARSHVGKRLEQKIIGRDRSVIPACDVQTLQEFREIVKQTADVEGIGGYKIGFELGLGFGLPAVVDAAREFTNKPIIYDHQKAGTDIPATGKNFAQTMKRSGVDTVIFFPQAGPETERAWIYHAFDQGLNVIVGGRMTHPAYAVS
ncbi:MAG: hypothetical protein AABW82_00200, partial [Nanoarchaeota archaeon]